MTALTRRSRENGTPSSSKSCREIVIRSSQPVPERRLEGAGLGADVPDEVGGDHALHGAASSAGGRRAGRRGGGRGLGVPVRQAADRAASWPGTHAGRPPGRQDVSRAQQADEGGRGAGPRERSLAAAGERSESTACGNGERGAGCPARTGTPPGPHAIGSRPDGHQARGPAARQHGSLPRSAGGEPGSGQSGRSTPQPGMPPGRWHGMRRRQSRLPAAGPPGSSGVRRMYRCPAKEGRTRAKDPETASVTVRDSARSGSRTTSSPHDGGPPGEQARSHHAYSPRAR